MTIAVATAASAAHRHHTAAAEIGPTLAETSYWASIRNSPDPDDLQSYFATYPHGRFVVAARARIKVLQRTDAASLAQAPAVVPDLSGRSRYWKKDERSNCWMYDPNNDSAKITLSDILPAFLFKPLDSEGNPENVTIGDLLPGLLTRKLSREADPADAKPIWSGGCDNQLASGEGTISWVDMGTTFVSITGNFRGGVLNGHGVSISSAGSRYEGKFVNTVPNGHGYFRTAEGNTYDGNWLNGHMSGHGFSTNATGVYDGDFLGDKQNGRGVFTLKSGDRLEGTWTNGMRNPSATYTFSDGARYVGDIPGQGTLTTPDHRHHPAEAQQDEQGAVNINLGDQ